MSSGKLAKTLTESSTTPDLSLPSRHPVNRRNRSHRLGTGNELASTAGPPADNDDAGRHSFTTPLTAVWKGKNSTSAYGELPIAHTSMDQPRPQTIVPAPSGLSVRFPLVTLAAISFSTGKVTTPWTESRKTTIEPTTGDNRLFVKALQHFSQLPKRSGSNSGLRGGWYQLSFSEFATCRLLGIGPISLASNPAPVEEQPVARTTVAPSATASKRNSFDFRRERPAQWSGTRVALLERHVVRTKD
jgi:hypothetical protein